MISWRHAVLFPCRATTIDSLLRELSSSDDVAALRMQHAAIIDHGALGELDVTIAGHGDLGLLVGHPAGTAALVGPLLMIAAVQMGFAHELEAAELQPPMSAVRELAEALPPRSTALLVVTPCGDSARVRSSLRAATGSEFVAFDVSSRLEPWLASKVEVDLRVESPTPVPLLTGAAIAS